jgi:hypothetical protein
MGFRISSAAAIATLAILGVAGGAAASNANFWTDPSGDSKNAADLTVVAAASDDAGKITFTLTYGNRPAGLTDDDQVQSGSTPTTAPRPATAASTTSSSSKRPAPS